MRNILVTEFDNNENVMIFTDKLTVDEVKNRLDAAKMSYTDIVDVPDSDVQFYCFEPCWL